MSTLIEIISISYISLHTILFIGTLCLIARSNLPDGAGICSASFYNQLRLSVSRRPALVSFAILHFIDVGLDYGVIFGWFLERNVEDEYRDIVSYHGAVLIFMMVLHGITKITSSLYIYGVTRGALPTILQLFDMEIYYDMYFDQNCIKMDIKIEQLYRSSAIMQAFPMCIIQTYFLVSYPLVLNKNDAYHTIDFSYLTFTFISLLSSLLFIICLQVNHDKKFLNMKDKMMQIGMPKWIIRVFFRSFELISRILILAYIWILYGILSVVVILFFDWFFQIYNHYRKDRYDNSSEHSIRMWRKQNKFFLWPLVMDELVSFWNFDMKLPARNPPKQRQCDIIDIIQGWTIASLIYGNKSIRKLTRERPPVLFIYDIILAH